MSPRWTKPLAAFVAGLLLGLLARRVVPPARSLASRGQREASPRSDILLYGADRDEFLRKRFVDRSQGFNSFGIRALYGQMPDGFALHAQQAAERFLGSRRSAAYRGTFTYGGPAYEVLIRFERSAADPTGLFVRRLETGHGAGEPGRFHPNGNCLNTLEDYDEQTGSLVFGTMDGFDISRDGLHRDLRVEFPMAPAAGMGGRLFAWNVDAEDFEVVGAVAWRALSEPEWESARAEWRRGWLGKPASHGGVACVMSSDSPADPEMPFD